MEEVPAAVARAAIINRNLPITLVTGNPEILFELSVATEKPWGLQRLAKNTRVQKLELHRSHPLPTR